MVTGRLAAVVPERLLAFERESEDIRSFALAGRKVEA
jgi:hypothetical protein